MHTLQSSYMRAPTSAIPLTENTAPVREFRCLYTHDLRQKKKRWHDGFLRYHTFNKRIMVYDTSRNFIADMHYTDSEGIVEGDDLAFELVLVQVQEYLQTIEQDLTALFTARVSKAEEVRQQGNAQTPNPSRRPQAQASLRQHGMLGGLSQVRTPQAPQTPLFQLRPKALNSLLGASRGPHGRAILPTFSPFEERQRQEAESIEDGRATKRLKRDATTMAGVGCVERHVSPIRPKQNGMSGTAERSLWTRSADRRRNIDEDEVVREASKKNVPARKAAATEHLLEEPMLSRNQRPAAREAKRPNLPKQPTPIHNESDPQPAASPLKAAPKRGRKIRATSSKIRTDIPDLLHLSPRPSPQLQPLRVLASRSTRKNKLLCQELAPQQPSGKADTLTRFHQQQQTRVQSRLESRQKPRANYDLDDLSQLRDSTKSGQKANQTTRATPQQAVGAPLRGKQVNQTRDVGGSLMPEHGLTSRQPLAAENHAAVCPSTRKGQPALSVDTHQKGNREVSKQNNMLKEPRLLDESRRQPNAPANVNGHKSALEMESGGAWAEEAFDLFEWRPPAVRDKETGK